jgi:hypothetical protein
MRVFFNINAYICLVFKEKDGKGELSDKCIQVLFTGRQYFSLLYREKLVASPTSIYRIILNSLFIEI